MGTVKSRQRCRGGSLQEVGAVLETKQKPVLSSDHNKVSDSGDHSQQINEPQTVLISQVHETKGKHRNKKGFSPASAEQALHPKVSSRSFSDKCFAVATTTSTTQSPKMASQSQTPLCYGSAHRPMCSCEGRFYRNYSCAKNVEGKVLHQHLNLDTHPVVTRLQNEQNLRLEGMELRMKKIRKNAQQEAERRKFAHLFRARTDDSLQTERLLKEASVALQLFKQEKELKKSCEQRGSSCTVDSDYVANKHLVPTFTHHQENDKGDIIPVHIVSDKSKSPKKMSQQKQFSSKVEQPLMWLLQPVETFHLSKFCC